MAESLARGARITGEQRTELVARLGKRYAGGESIRAIAADTGRSFGFVHGMIKESGVPVRGRGGATRGPAAVAALDPSGPTVPTESPSTAATIVEEVTDAVKGLKSKKPSKRAEEKKVGKKAKARS